MAQVGTAWIDVKGDLTSLNKSLGAFFGGSKLGSLGKKAGLLIGVGLAGGLAAAGIGKGLFDLGQKFDTEFDKIRVASGKTGKELDGLEDSFRNVVKSIPTDFGSAGDAISELAKRTELTGEPLERLARQILQLSRITKTDAGENVRAITRLFGDWSVSTEDQSTQLNKLFRVGQKTGITLGDLSRLMVKFGSPLRTLGFDFEQTAALFGRFEREGVNLQTTLPGFKQALKNFAKPTEELSAKFKKFGVNAEEPRAALLRIFELLKELPKREGTQLAFQVFGSRAATDMARAVKEGRFELDDLIKSMNTGSDSINKAEKDTRDFAEQWELLKNRVFVGLEPLASKVFDTIGDGMEKLATADFDKIGADLGFDTIDTSGLETDLSEASARIRSILDSGLVKFIASNVVGGVKRGLQGMVQAFRGALTSIAGILKLIDDLLHLRFGEVWGDVKQIFSGGVKASIGTMRAMSAPMRELASRAGAAILTPFRGAWSRVKDIFSGGVRGALAVLRGMAGTVADVGGRIGSALKRSIEVRVGAIGGAFRLLRRVAEGSFGGIRSAVQWVIDKVRDLLDLIPKIKFPKPPDLNPFAKGGTVTTEALALVGEEGPELAKFAGKTGLVGLAGPEIRAFPENTRIYSHPETKRKLAPVVQKVSRVLAPGTAEGISDERSVTMRLEDEATGGVEKLRELIAKLPTRKKFTLDAGVNLTSGLVDLLRMAGRGSMKSLRLAERARGGTVREKFTIVGEEGPELVTLPTGSRVHPNAQSMRMLRRMQDEDEGPQKTIVRKPSMRKLIERVWKLASNTYLKDQQPQLVPIEKRVEVAKPNAIAGEEGPELVTLPIGPQGFPVLGTKQGEGLQGQALSRGLGDGRIAQIPGFARGGVIKKDEEDRDPTAKRGQDLKDPGKGKQEGKPEKATGSGRAMLTRADKLDRLHLPYKWGGGHGNVAQALKSGFDCSGAVSYVLGIPPRVSGALANWGAPGKGPVSVFANAKHTIMSLFGRGFGTSKENPGGGAGWLSFDSFPNMTVRHAPGIKGKDGEGEEAGPKYRHKGKFSLGQMVSLAKRAGFPDPALAAAVGYAESKGNTAAHNKSAIEDSRGLWQINVKENANPKYAKWDLSDAFRNVKAAFQISKGGKDFTPWTMYTNKQYRDHLGGKATPLPKGKGGAAATGSSYADLIELSLTEAKGSPTLRDDFKWLNRGLRYWRGVYRRNKRVGNHSRANDALNKVNEYADQKKALRKGDAEEATYENLGSLAPTIGTGPNAFRTTGLEPLLEQINLDKANAALTIPRPDDDSQSGLTASLQDDIAAATKLVGIWDGLRNLATGFQMPSTVVPGTGTFEPTPEQSKQLAKVKSQPKRIALLNRFISEWKNPPPGPFIQGTIKQKIDAATNLKSARDELKSLGDEIGSKAVEAGTTPDPKVDQRAFLASLGDLFKNFGPNFKPLQSFADGGIIQGPKGRKVVIEGHGGEAVINEDGNLTVTIDPKQLERMIQQPTVVNNVDARHTFANVPKDPHRWSQAVKEELTA